MDPCPQGARGIRGNAFPARIGEQGSAAGARPETRPPRVFVIDDEEGICRFVAGAVGNLGCEAESFTNAQVALRALRRSPPDIIFLDIAIGGSDAIDVLRNLADYGFRGVVQVMSGSNPSLLEDVRKVGERHKLVMRPPLQKPFRFDAIQKDAGGRAPRSVDGGSVFAQSARVGFAR